MPDDVLGALGRVLGARIDALPGVRRAPGAGRRDPRGALAVSIWACASRLAVVGALLSATLCATEVPSVRIVEVGDGGTLFAEVAPRAVAEVTAKEPFRGSLFATLRAWQKEDVGDRVSWGDRVRVPLDLAKGTTPVAIELPSMLGAILYGRQPPTLEFVWILEDRRGQRLGSGRQAARLERAPAERLLRLSTEPGDGFRRPPAAAFETPDRYAPYAVVLVSPAGLSSLDTTRRQALFDATALGLTLAVSADGTADPFGPLGSPFDQALGSERTIFRADGGEELREAALLQGRIRRTTLPAAIPPKGTDDAGLVPYMLLTSARSTAETGPLLHWSAGSPGSLFSQRKESRNHECTQAARTGLLLILACSAGTLGLLFWTSRKYGRPPRAPALAALASCAISPFVVYLAQASRGAGNFDDRFEVTVHDATSPVASRGVYDLRGGGGGTEPVRFTFRRPERGIVLTRSWTQLAAEPRGKRGVEVTTSRRADSDSTLTFQFTREVVPREPLWETNLRRDGDRVAGTIRARRDVKDAWLLWGGSGVRVGTLPAGSSLEVSSLSPVSSRDLWSAGLRELEGARMGSGSWWLAGEIPRTYWAQPECSDACLLAEEPSGGAGGRRFAFESLRVEGGPQEVRLRVPAFKRGAEILAAIPGAIPVPPRVTFLAVDSPFMMSEPRTARLQRGSSGVAWTAFSSSHVRAEERIWQFLRSDLPREAGYLVVQAREER